jgi:hypothetical protein
MASRDSIDGIEVAETSFNVNSDERKGIKEGTTEEDGRNNNTILGCDMSIVFTTLKL